MPVIPAPQENCLNPGGRGCGEPRLRHCTPAWVTRVKLRLKKKKKKTFKKNLLITRYCIVIEENLKMQTSIKKGKISIFLCPRDSQSLSEIFGGIILPDVFLPIYFLQIRLYYF